MDNTAALADVINRLIEDPTTDVTTPHGLARKAGIPWATLRRHLVDPGVPAPLRLDQLGRIASALDMKASTLLALAEEREKHSASDAA
jgi:hypothetical protein